MPEDVSSVIARLSVRHIISRYVQIAACFVVGALTVCGYIWRKYFPMDDKIIDEILKELSRVDPNSVNLNLFKTMYYKDNPGFNIQIVKETLLDKALAVTSEDHFGYNTLLKISPNGRDIQAAGGWIAYLDGLVEKHDTEKEIRRLTIINAELSNEKMLYEKDIRWMQEHALIFDIAKNYKAIAATIAAASGIAVEKLILYLLGIL
jgi:hypothetical protein